MGDVQAFPNGAPNGKRPRPLELLALMKTPNGYIIAPEKQKATEIND